MAAAVVEIKDKLFLSKEEAAAYVGTSRQYITQLIAEGKLKTVNIGVGDGMLKIKRSEIERWSEAVK